MKTTTNSIRIAITLLALLLPCLHTGAQNGSPELIPDVPPSPQAVAFNRLGDYQVNNNYGAPDINIPLFEIDFHGYKIPLTLHYEATPLKPGYNYDVTGVGWTLSGNSCVSRTIKDIADECTFFSYSTPFTLNSFLDPSGMQMMYTDYKDVLNRLNYQYDSYNIVLPSGRTIPFFMYKNDGVMTYDLMPSDGNVKINCTLGTNTIDAFAVTDENGVTYHFTVADKASTGFDNDPNASRNVTWLLTSIVIPAKGTITYDYTEVQSIHTYTVEEPVLKVSRLMSQMPEDSQLKRFDVSTLPQPDCPRYRMRFLKSISYGPTRVDFSYQLDGKHMKDIVVSESGDTIRKYTLAINGLSSYGSSLTSLVISGQNDEDRLVYGFSYWNSNPGDRTDYWGNRCFSNSAKDVGNFNMFFNKEEDGHVPFLDRNSLQQQLATYNYVQLLNNEEGDPYYYYKIKLQSTPNGDTRQPTSPELHGVLKRITYPNGGYTEFSFENHRFPTATAADGDFVFDRRSQRIIEGGGFRVKSIINYTVNDSVANEDHYRYGFTLGDIIHRNFPLPLPENLNLNDTVNHHIGCGEAVVDPNLLTFMTFSYYRPNYASFINFRQFQKMVLGQDSEAKYMINPQGSATWWDALFSADTFRSLLGGRRPVVYPEITVYHGNPDIPSKCRSKTVYKYDIYTVHHDQQTYYLLSFNQTATADTAYFERIYYDNFSDAPALISDNSLAAKRHQLRSKSDYSFNTNNNKWDLISEEEYSYNEESLQKIGNIFNSFLSRECRTNNAVMLSGHQWLEDFSLGYFYKTSSQNLGRSTMSEKTITTLRQGGTRSRDNTHIERYSYLYPDVLKTKDYTDLIFGIRSEYNSGCDKKDEYSFIGEVENSSDTVITELKSRNMLASLISAETSTLVPWPSKISGGKMDYAFFGNNILPSKLYEANGDVYEESLEVVSYDSYGNPTEVEDLKTGIHSVFIWDTYGRYLLAMIKNATLTQVGNVSQLLSGTSVTRYAALKVLLPNAQIETWDYKPLIGVSSHTNVNGETVLYEYDGLGRLKAEKRVVNGMSEPEILHEYEYNYMNPQYY